MADQSAAHESYDLAVIGAGIAGLNALHAAHLHLPTSARILLIDEKDAPGGMWNMAYDYVRLHQPHPFFTVGAIKWNWRKPRSYLARRDEVQGHLAHCLEKLREDRGLDLRLGHVARDLREVPSEDGWQAAFELHPKNAPEQRQTIVARRVINAEGFNYAAPEPIALSSTHVTSVTPANLLPTLAKSPGAPVYVVGGGKTGMDTILAIQDDDPKCAITLINGGGTYFLSRDMAFPIGLRRWYGGVPPARVLHDCAMRFDGHNEEAVRAHFVAHYAANRDPRSQSYVWGLLSEAENRRIEACLQTKIWDYLEDVIDTPEGPQMRLRGGALQAVAPGSIFVACTGSLFREGAAADRTPCLSPNDVILSITTRHAMHVLTTYAGFTLSHLFFDGKLRSSGLYFLDLERLLRADKQAFAAASMAQAYHNMLMGFRNLSRQTRAHFGLDLNLWQPKLRRLIALNSLRKTARDDVRHCRAVLDTVAARFGVQGGVLPDRGSA